MKFAKFIVLAAAAVGSLLAVSCCPNTTPAPTKSVYVQPSK